MTALGLAVLLFALVVAARHGEASEHTAMSAAREPIVRVFEGGVERGELTVQQVLTRGLTVVDLSDGFRPRVLTDAPALGAAGVLPYGSVYDALADERIGQGDEWRRARADRYFELYGIFPNLRVLRARFADRERHRCHDAIENAPIAALRTTLPPSGLGAPRRLAALRRSLEAARADRGLASIEELASVRGQRARLARLERLSTRVETVCAVQAHLRCDGFLPRRASEGALDRSTVQAIRLFQRRQMIPDSGRLDPDTRGAFLAGSRELDFRALLRTLRERVVDATGLIEDGSARGEWGRVVGRDLDASELRAASRYSPLENGAPDLVSAATDAAARALGWTDPTRAAAWLARHARDGTRERRVGLRLPPLPDYHGDSMDLRAVIDRGDVRYDYPYRRGGRRARVTANRATLRLIARTHSGEIVLVRYSTTIGGWKPERVGRHRLVLRYKESDVGVRVWRDIVAAPTWQPPPSTPDRELVHRAPGGGYELNREAIGPSYASAYGLVALIHHEPLRSRGDTLYRDNGVRSHGSGDYRTIMRGESHGCHRLFNHLALRLASFLMRHRAHVHRGVRPDRYARLVRSHGVNERLRVETRGSIVELTPPVPVEVLPGRIRGERRTPLTRAMPLLRNHRRAARSRV